MVEFALIAPIFFAFILVTIEGAFYINAQATIDNVTREVARAVAVCGATQGPYRYGGKAYEDCRAVAVGQEDQLTYLPNNGLSPIILAVCSASIPASGKCAAGTASDRYEQPKAAGNAIEVDVTYTYRFMIFPLFGDVGPTVPISSSARTVAQQ